MAFMEGGDTKCTKRGRKSIMKKERVCESEVEEEVVLVVLVEGRGWF